jgi:hypothetical protein
MLCAAEIKIETLCLFLWESRRKRPTPYTCFIDDAVPDTHRTTARSLPNTPILLHLVKALVRLIEKLRQTLINHLGRRLITRHFQPSW